MRHNDGEKVLRNE
jgi:hypothetical protein